MGATDPQGEGMLPSNMTQNMIHHLPALDGPSSGESRTRSLPSSLSFAEVRRQQVLGRTEKALSDIRTLRRDLETFNDAALGAAINAAELEVMAIKHRLTHATVAAPDHAHFTLTKESNDALTRPASPPDR